MSIPNTPARDAPTPAVGATGKFVTGSTLQHVISMTAAGTVGLIAIFFVDALNLFYISLLGQQELAAAVGYAGAVLFANTSIGIGLSIASTALTARALGRGDRVGAERLAGAALLITALLSTVLALALLPLLAPLLALLGARGQTAELALRFLQIVLPSFPLMGLGLCLAGLLRALGDARRAMYVTLGSAAAAAVLDPLLIFGFGLGLDGAALATVCARTVLLAIGLHGLLRVHRLFARPRLATLRLMLSPYMAIALPAVMTQIATPVAQAFVTRGIAPFGDDAVAGWAVIGRITPLAFGAIFALSGAVGPILGQNYGAGRFDRLHSTLRDSLIVTLLYVCLMWALLALGSEQIARLFNAHGLAHELIVLFCVLVAGSFVFNGALFVANAAFNNLGYPFYSTALNWGRATLGVLPFVAIGGHWWGAPGVIVGYGLGSVVFGSVAGVLCFRVLARLEHRAPVRAPAAAARP